MSVVDQPKIVDLLKANQASGTRGVSFEYFPPKTEKGEEVLYQKLERMGKLGPVFMDFTWGAGGSTHEKTPELCLNTMKRYNQIVNMHLTCTNMPMEKVDTALAFCKQNGIRNIVALRGDPPAGQEWHACDHGFTCALDLIKYIRSKYGDYFCLSVAGYPEGHPNKINGPTGPCSPEAMEEELAYLKQKVDAGGDLIITQLFFDVQQFLKFERRCREIGITVPILPGILPMQSHAGLLRMCGFCKTYLPPDVVAETERLKDDEHAFKEYGIRQATDMCKALAEAKVTHFHFYTINVEHATEAVMANLGLIPQSLVH
eukprot:PhF_6_TR11291/c0_g1_i1/m.18222/K00297/metF, MTHFR; methylenetetrahydrofolate reductase (NADPH)